ncbi:hypothetical protein [Corynebacterium pseudogenitalium]|uniref:hypothetical protein n=1 Tax=Corynebacterium pseudogenitalium TaxID=38303 RepID=UPI00210C5386|nr:hypothetical protein [Corynebacterium pseudogenitalium]MCQ4607358.1 hypothetical protein [Corynebacterium pseudogenitalium]
MSVSISSVQARKLLAAAHETEERTRERPAVPWGWILCAAVCFGASLPLIFVLDQVWPTFLLVPCIVCIVVIERRRSNGVRSSIRQPVKEDPKMSLLPFGVYFLCISLLQVGPIQNKVFSSLLGALATVVFVVTYVRSWKNNA